MSVIWAKLNLKDHGEIVVLDAPDSFASELQALNGVRVHERVSAVRELNFALAFVVKKADLDKVSAAIIARAATDPVLWFAYPKGTSKKYRCDFNRDTGWDVLRKAGFDTVR